MIYTILSGLDQNTNKIDWEQLNSKGSICVSRALDLAI